MRTINILGSTGSIGTQALQIAALHPDLFRVGALTAHSQAEALFDQVRRFRPQMASLTGLAADAVEIPEDLRFCDWHFGQETLLCAAASVPCDDVLVSVVGMVGLPAVMAARKAGRRVLLANKEALVAGGQIVMAACADGPDGPTLIPVDSEHSAIYQCLRAAQGNPYEKILLTASGGAFRNFTLEQLKGATLAQALTHPNWSMGAKITVDSASMFNKALEIIEARWLFDARPEQIEVLIHPQSIVHSMVQFRDGAVLAQLGAPDMRVPIAYAMAYPQRIETAAPKADFPRIGQCTFTAVDPVRFPAVGMAYEALRLGGAACCMLNAANEEANARFRAGGLDFMQIGRVVEETLSRIGNLPAHTIEEVYAADAAAHREARRVMERLNQE
ncbi:MAG: 1-deoxy-D-xylulose-5-phosphate reductoisomerase [Clostridia bacterium]|nr:1-deoxy-D-xylulose-5-phosphate reductoisomerase [Clostridia bacterium]